MAQRQIPVLLGSIRFYWATSTRTFWSSKTLSMIKQFQFVTNGCHHRHKNTSIRYCLSTPHHHNSERPKAMTYPASLQRQPDDMSSLSLEQSWKEAASLIILARNDSSTLPSQQHPIITFDYKSLMVKRSIRSSFFASAYVFPGGQVELSDFDPKWYRLFEDCGIKREELNRLSTDIVGPRPPIVTNPITLKNNHLSSFINLDLGLRISAIRETFEEAGILVLSDPKNCKQLDYCPVLTSESLNVNLAKWQQKVRSDSKQFFEFCDTLKMVPNLWALYEWSNWLTPVSVGHRRFDTIFYVCCFNRTPPVFVDNAEVTTPIWCDPIQILEEHQSEKLFLAPPQVYELSRMLRFPEMDRFQKFLKSRQTLGCQRWLPVIYTYDDGALSLVPGDEQYPQEPELISGRKPVAEVEGSIHDANRMAKSKNRMELLGIRCRTLCNVEPGCGHLPPITYPFEEIYGSKFSNGTTTSKL